MIKLDDFIKRAKEVHGDKYDYSKVNYKKITDKVCIICPEHGEFWQEARMHYRGQGCPKCAVDIRSAKKTSNSDEFIQKAKEIYGDYYDYSMVEYVNSRTPVKIICPLHGIFEVTPHDHLRKKGCRICGNKRKGASRKLNTEKFIKKAKEVHGETYDYSKTKYISSINLVTITCPVHGDFEQNPSSHLRGHCCPKCAAESRAEKQTLSTADFIEKARSVHGDRYDYSKTIYVRNDSPVIITCPDHGDFLQKPSYHLDGCGCQKCGALFSHYESELGDFVASIVGDENVVRNDRSVLEGNELDVYVPSKKIAFEFDGLYWHSEIKKTNKKYHLIKSEQCEAKGVRLIHIFEDEWVHKSDICKSRIKNLLGASDKTIYARKCTVVEVSANDAKKFFNENHIQGSVHASFILGLQYDGELVSAMSFGPQRKNMGRNNEDGAWEMLRFCNKVNCNVVGGASKLMAHFLSSKSPNKVISYADKRWSVGELYEKLGFEHIHDSEPSYFYVIGDERKNRFGYRKDILVSKYGCSPTDTEHNFCFNKGWYRIYDCGAMLYEWKKR